MEKTDLQFYLTWLKDQLKLSVSLPSEEISSGTSNQYLEFSNNVFLVCRLSFLKPSIVRVKLLVICYKYSRD